MDDDDLVDPPPGSLWVHARIAVLVDVSEVDPAQAEQWAQDSVYNALEEVANRFAPPVLH